MGAHFSRTKKEKKLLWLKCLLNVKKFTNCHSLEALFVYLHTKRIASTRYIYRWVWYVHTFQSFVYSCNVRYSTKKKNKSCQRCPSKKKKKKTNPKSPTKKKKKKKKKK